MKKYFSTSEARKQLSELVNQVSYGGGCIGIGRHGKVEAYLVPADKVAPATADTPAKGQLSVLDKKPALRRLAKKYGLKLMVLFGSHVTGKLHRESDIDLAIMPGADLPWKKEQALYFDLMRFFSRDDVDLINLKNSRSVVLHYEVGWEGALIYEAHSSDFERFRMRAFFDYHDFEPYFKMQEKAISKQLKELM